MMIRWNQAHILREWERERIDINIDDVDWMNGAKLETT